MFQNNRKEMSQRPFKVFRTEEEWQEAIDEEIARRSSQYEGEEYEEGENPKSFERDSLESERIKQMLLAQAEKIKEKVPDFDFVKMLKEDPEFRERILKGYSVEEAYYLSNRKKYDEPTPKKKMSMRENGRNNFKGATAPKNVSNMSDEEFKKYINSIKGSKL